MVNNTQIVSVSIPKAMVDFIEEAELSPSQMIQEAIIEKKQLWEKANNVNKHLLQNIAAFQAMGEDYAAYLETKGLYTEFLGWRNTRKDTIKQQNAIV